jgi:NADP-dependent 3-hydroxy acid dehydrogenase YdfG
MKNELAGRAAVVTGASSGLGRAIALRLGEAGIEQWLVGRSEKGLNLTVEMIAKKGGASTHCEVLNLREEGKVGDLIKRVGAVHPHLFAVINNAGLMHPERILVGQMDRWRAMFEVNVLALLEACRAGVEVMRQHKQPGHLINVGSIASKFEAGGVYGASKAAVDIISRSLRLELEEDDIRVTTIVPGGFATQLGRYVGPDSFAALAADAKRKGYDLSKPNEKLMGDPDHLARAVMYVLEQPININIQEIVIRPPVNISF